MLPMAPSFHPILQVPPLLNYQNHITIGVHRSASRSYVVACRVMTSALQPVAWVCILGIRSRAEENSNRVPD
ncbi:unnamed protein product [Linum trigynum]|uniref:Uncharacterized protein n=1 Tax=Linum trigynum TaxID=586398 RepID=A0AAV2D2G1_9ROSI